MKKMLYSGAAALLAAVAVNANAVPLATGALPANAFITFGGLDWVWASPCSPTGCGNGQDALDLSVQGAFGWRLPTAAEFAARPQASDFAFRGANVPFGGSDANGTSFGGAPSDAACGAAYFTAGFFNHCDYGDGNIGAIYGSANWANEPNVETWLVRGAVPEASTWAMMIAGLAFTGLAMRRRKVAVRFA